MIKPVIGWDIGGAHVKAVMLGPQGEILRVTQQACALWKGLELLENTFVDIFQVWQIRPDQYRHAVTMTGELVDLFDSRPQGVRAIAHTVKKYMPEAVFYRASEATGASFTATAEGHESHIASMNWHASAQCLSMHAQIGAALIVDIGSTTTDITFCQQQQVVSNGWTDAERMANHGLVYTGVVRTPLMAFGPYIEWQGKSRHLAAEYFATTADVYRILKVLPSQHDLADTADGQDRSVVSSMRRLARMLGHDVEDADAKTWYSLAHAFRQQQLACLSSAIRSGMALAPIEPQSLIGLGAGSFLLPDLAKALNLSYTPASSLMVAEHMQLKDDAVVCFPAYAVARLWQAWH